MKSDRLQNLYNLDEQRAATLARVRSAIEDMLIVLEDESPDTPAFMRVSAVVSRLRASEARLESGLRKRDRK